MKNLQTALKDVNLSASIEMVNVADDDDATQLKFLGSPHFRVDGEDLWHEEREIYSLSCRVYPTPEGIKGFPTVSMLRDQLRNFEQV